MTYFGLPDLSLLSHEMCKWEASSMTSGTHSPSVCEIKECRECRNRKT